MKYWTLEEITTKVNQDLDLEDETFVSPSELTGYINEAIDEAEAEIQKLNEDYFLKKSTISLVSGQSEYDLPTDIYADKIRRIVYVNGSIITRVDRLRDWRKFENLAVLQQNTSSNGTYNWMLVNSTPGSPQLVLAPIPAESGAYLQLWYIRNANRLEEDSDICDIPEFVNFVIQYAKVRCYEKEVGHPNTAKAMQDLEMQRDQMLSTLQSRTPDTEDTIEADLSLYEEMT